MDVPPQQVTDLPPLLKPERAFYWQTTQLENSAEVLTLFCKSCGRNDRDLPVLALLRDNLGSPNGKYDRLTDVWLLGDTQSRLWQRVLAGVPFFYWRAGKGHHPSARDKVKPVLNVSRSGNQVITGLGRELAQWMVLDGMTMPVRASSRAYRSNVLDQRRVHLEQAIGYLSGAPVGDGPSQLTRTQLNLVIAKLEARKRLLGGLMSEQGAIRAGENDQLEDVTIRAQNWDLLRQCAEKTGLVFTPLHVTGASGEYALLWFPEGASATPTGSDLKPIWRLLNIRDPNRDPRVGAWKGPVLERQVDAQGRLLPNGETGVRSIRLVPIGAYSLDYPRQPLLLVDFMGSAHVRRHEMTQRSINEITSGLIGISHFTNWYYYVGADIYDFVASRRGVATEQDERLDCYSRFRAALALDHDLDPALRADMEARLQTLALNPLENAPGQEADAAWLHYETLQKQIADGRIAKRVDQERRAELASFGASRKGLVAKQLLHDASLGIYTARVRKSDDLIARVANERLLRSDLAFLTSVAAAGARPEVSFDIERLRSAVQELAAAMNDSTPAPVRADARQTIAQVRSLTADIDLEHQCVAALHQLDHTTKPGIAAALRSEMHQ